MSLVKSFQVHVKLQPIVPEVGDSKFVGSVEMEFFHSFVAKLLYLAKRVRPDILVAVSYLTKRVKSPNISDMSKLERVIKYLRNTKEMGIILEAENYCS